MQEDIITVKATFDKIEKVSRSIGRKKKNSSITTSSVIISAEFNPRGPNVSKIINKLRNLLEMDNTLKQLFPKNSITILKKKEQTCKNFSQEPTLTTSKVFY